MKFFIAAIFISLFIGSCDNDSFFQDSLNQEIDIAQGEKLKIAGTGEIESEKLEIHVTDIIDSRCPADALCIWYGNAIVTFVINNKEIAYNMCIGQCNGKIQNSSEITVQTAGGNYVVQLVEVVPFPGTGNEGEPKKAKFIISK